jgi:catechol 2,3-dioxygenase-like lactoylglutathione lyase family enzyme
MTNHAPLHVRDDDTRTDLLSRAEDARLGQRSEMSPDGTAYDHRMTTEESAPGPGWPGGIAAITLFVEDLEKAKGFYEHVFELPVFFEDSNSAVYKFGETLVNLLRISEAPSLVAPAAVAEPGAGVRFQFTLDVEDVDSVCERLRERGVELLNGPMDRPWGIRTASFRDPGGHIWEIAR